MLDTLDIEMQRLVDTDADTTDTTLVQQVVGSSLFLLVNSQGLVLTSVARPEFNGRNLSGDALVSRALGGGQATGF